MLEFLTSSGLLQSIFSIILEVVAFWRLKLTTWWQRKPIKSALIDILADAHYYEEWEGAALELDELIGNDLWRQNPTSKYYDYRLIHSRLQSLHLARADGDVLALVSLLRAGLVRNLGNITAPRLFNRAYAGTKLLIEDYITQLALAVEHVASYPTPGPLSSHNNDTQSGETGHGNGNGNGGLTSQAKLDLLHDTRQAFGRTALVLQGGAIFGLCHIGVVKALHLRGLLPRIIVGTATGALIAALVGVHTEDELLEFLTPEGIDLSAFATRPARRKAGTDATVQESTGMLETLVRRVKRFIREGYFLDVKMLEDCVRSNVGDLTFEEAYARTKRVLNITVPVTGGGGIPSLLNYLTAPNVLIYSAATASNSTSLPLFRPITLLCKDPLTGRIYPWSNSSSSSTSTNTTSTPKTHIPAINTSPAESPLHRLSSLFNINHFILSQARPYIAPFLQTSDLLTHSLPRHTTTRRQGRFLLPLLRTTMLEIQHRLRQLDTFGLLPASIRRFLVDELMPGAVAGAGFASSGGFGVGNATGSGATSVTLVPELTAGDFVRLLERPSRRAVKEWILRGERSVWPAVGALKVRCAVEVELDRAYQVVRRRKPMDVDTVLDGEQERKRERERGDRDDKEKKSRLRGSGEKRRKVRSNSLGGGSGAGSGAS